MTTPRRWIAVYCASSRRVPVAYLDEARAVGRELGRLGHGLVWGGGRTGCMGAVADGAREAGAPLFGVIPEFMKDHEIAYLEADELVVTADMRERRRLMEERADAFVVLAGSIGTMEEFFEIVVGRYLRRHAKPVVLANTDGFYDGILTWSDRMMRDGFKSGTRDDLFTVTPDGPAALAAACARLG